MENWQGTNFTQEEFFEEQEKIPVEISPPEPGLVPLTSFSAGGGIHDLLARNIAAAGYKQPTPVQSHGIPFLFTGKDVMACAQTGSGKTAFFLFPPINKMLHDGTNSWQDNPVCPSVLIMGPTRELCVQISEEAQKFTKNTKLQIAVVYGGTEYKESFRQLKGGVDIMVATPGRLHDLCDRKAVNLRQISMLILDEADRMLDMGFEPQIRKIVQSLGMPKTRQTVMTSATFPPEVQHIAQEFMLSYSFMAVGRVGGTVSTIQQRLAWVEDVDKDCFLFGLLMHQSMLGLMLIFVNTKQQATELERFVSGCGFSTQSIHGDRTQQQREDALRDFKSARSPVLIATDVAARGLDIPDVAIVVQYDLAMSAEDYVHRIGRTGRIGKKGISVGMVNNRQKGVAADLCKVLEDGGNVPPAFLIGMALSTGNYVPGENGGPATYGGQDVRKSLKKGFQTAEEREQAKRFTGFAQNAYAEGDADKMKEVAQSIGPAMEGSYQGAAAQGKGKKGKGKGSKGGKGGKDSSVDAASFTGSGFNADTGSNWQGNSHGGKGGKGGSRAGGAQFDQAVAQRGENPAAFSGSYPGFPDPYQAQAAFAQAAFAQAAFAQGAQGYGGYAPPMQWGGMPGYGMPGYPPMQ